MNDRLEIGEFLDAVALADWRAALRAADGAPAGLMSKLPGGLVAPSVRRTTRLHPGGTFLTVIVAHVEAHRAAIERWYGASLGACEEPQCLRYDPGDYFVAHQDGNTPMVHDASRHRRVSIVIFLSGPDDYAGGELMLHGPRNTLHEPEPVAPPAGTLVAFRAETTHEVTVMTGGERFTIATWLRAPGT